jgi:hypothetical protein
MSRKRNTNMHETTQTLYDAVRRRLGRDVGPADLARALNVSEQVVTNWGSRGVSLDGALKAQLAFGVDANFVLHHAPHPMVAPVPVTGPVHEVRDTQAAPWTLTPARGHGVPLLAAAGSMGMGEEQISSDVMKDLISLDRDFIETQLRPTSMDALRFLHGYGDSMAPTLHSGDILLVDTGVVTPEVDGIYVLEAHQRLFIKRVRQRMDGAYEVSSDNPTHRTVDTLDGSHQVEVRGRVIWIWNGKRV